MDVIDHHHGRALLLKPGPDGQKLLTGCERALPARRAQLGGQLVGNIAGHLVAIGPDGHELVGEPGQYLSKEGRLSGAGHAFDPDQPGPTGDRRLGEAAIIDSSASRPTNWGCGPLSIECDHSPDPLRNGILRKSFGRRLYYWMEPARAEEPWSALAAEASRWL